MVPGHSKAFLCQSPSCGNGQGSGAQPCTIDWWGLGNAQPTATTKVEPGKETSCDCFSTYSAFDEAIASKASMAHLLCQRKLVQTASSRTIKPWGKSLYSGLPEVAKQIRTVSCHEAKNTPVTTTHAHSIATRTSTITPIREAKRSGMGQGHTAPSTWVTVSDWGDVLVYKMSRKQFRTPCSRMKGIIWAPAKMRAWIPGAVCSTCQGMHKALTQECMAACALSRPTQHTC